MTEEQYGVAVGVTLQGVDKPEVFREHVRFLDTRGFTHLWITDSSLHARCVYAYLTLAALHSERLFLGTGVTHPYTRHPAITVNAIATIGVDVVDMKGLTAVFFASMAVSAVESRPFTNLPLDFCPRGVTHLRA